MQPPVHAGGAWCGRKVPGGEFCPQNGYLLWMPKENCSRLSTQGCLVWTQGARRLLLSTEWVSFVDAGEKCSRLSTQRVPGVDARCQKVTFVHRMGIICGSRRKMQPPIHAEGAWCGRKVPGGEFCPQNGYLLWMPKKNATACPQNGPPAWTQGASASLRKPLRCPVAILFLFAVVVSGCPSPRSLQRG